MLHGAVSALPYAAKILLIQQGYIQALEKLNVATGNTKFPDFALVKHDSYVDILEIKRPDTNLMKLDAGRRNYYWDPEISKAIVQLENYLESVSRSGSELRSYIKDTYEIDLKVLRPRGIILAGKTSHFMDTQKMKDDFRLLTQSLKNIQIVSYDELHTRLENYIAVLERFSE